MKLSKKQMIIGGSVLALGITSIFVFRKNSLRYYDNVWCDDSSCSEYDTQEKVNSYIQETGGNVGFHGRKLNAAGDTDDSGYYQIIFNKPHGLKKGDKIIVDQDSGATFPYYDGATTVKSVMNDFVIQTPKARQGSSPFEGGYVIKQSIWGKLIG